MPFYPPQWQNRYPAPRPSDTDPKMAAAVQAAVNSSGVYTPGPAAPAGAYAQTPSSGRPPVGGHVTQNEQPGWVVLPGQYVNLALSVRTVEAVHDGVFVPAPTGALDNTSPPRSVGGLAGVKAYVRS
jgi:hypothetical protein